MKKKRRLVLIVILVLVATVAGIGYWQYARNPAGWQAEFTQLPEYLPEELQSELGIKGEDDDLLTASGFIEVDELVLAPEVSGQIQGMTVDEGDQVELGQLLVALDPALLEADIAAAEAAIGTAEALLAQVEAGPRVEDVKKVEAGVVLAEAQVKAADQAVQDAILLRDSQQELDLQIEAGRTQLALDALAVERAIPLKDAAELANSLAQRQVDIVNDTHHYSVWFGPVKKSGTFHFDEGSKRQASADWNLKGTQLWQSWISLEEAQVKLEASQRYLDKMLEVRNNPRQLDLAASLARADYEDALAAVPVAEAQVEIVKVGARQEQIAVFQARLDQARAELEALKVKMAKYEILSPIDGQVIRKVAHEGEVVLQGSTLMTLANLDTLKLTVYVPEPDVGRVSLGQRVEMSVDSYPDRVFLGQVQTISDQAEFTPKNVQTKDQRANLVFGVKVEIPNPDHHLRPGMPADAVFVE